MILKSYQIKAILEGLPGQPLNGGVKAEAGYLIDMILQAIFVALFPEGSSVNHNDVLTRIADTESETLIAVSRAAERAIRGNTPDVARADADVIKRMINKAVGGKPEIPNDTLRLVGQMMAQLVRSMLADMIERNVFGVNHARLDVDDVKETARHLCEGDRALAAIMTKNKICEKSEKKGKKSKSKKEKSPKLKKADCEALGKSYRKSRSGRGGSCVKKREPSMSKKAMCEMEGKIYRKGRSGKKGSCVKKREPSMSKKAMCEMEGKIYRKGRSGKTGSCVKKRDPSMSKKAMCEREGTKYIRGSRSKGRKSSCRKISK